MSKGPDETTLAKVAQVAGLVSSTGHFPKKDEHPGLYYWLYYQRSMDRDGKLHPEKVSLFDSRLPGWRMANLHFKTFSRAREAADVIEATGRFPSRSEHRPLWEWMAKLRVRYRRGEVPPTIVAEFDPRVVDWLQSCMDFDRAKKHVNNIRIYRDATGKWPTTRNIEKRMVEAASWLAGMRSSKSKGLLDLDREKQLDAELPGWSYELTTNWGRSVTELVAFVHVNGRYPSTVSKIEHERWLSRWLGDQRRGRGLTAERADTLDDALADWRTGTSRKTTKRALELPWVDAMAA